jgi:predicted GNAT family N-acyltransferase
VSWRIEPLTKRLGREDFDCGESSLNEFLKRFARQNDSKDISRTYVLLEEGADTVVGYYTLCSGSVSFASLPEEQQRKLPRYPIPTAHIGRLAICRSRQGEKLGALLLADALKRTCDIADRLGIHAVTVQALNKKAAAFYRAFGFIAFIDDPMHLFLPMATIRKL